MKMEMGMGVARRRSYDPCGGTGCVDNMELVLERDPEHIAALWSVDLNDHDL